MDFKGFSPDSFEQFIRALALKVIGPGVTVFGNGPDGGREASFQGKIDFPHPPHDIWDGYGVIQAKFKEKTETTQKDQAWAKKQLEDELKKWLNNQERTPKPDYFIFCTNVELSSANNGGKDTLKALFEHHKDGLGLKGYAIWDANQLEPYVDGQAEIRQRFSCFFTPGDLLAEFAKKLHKTPDSDAILSAYLCKEIQAEGDARLSQAGDRSGDRIKLADVFIDLPSSDAPNNEPPEEEENDLLPASMHDLLSAASCKLDPLALHEQSAKSQIYGRFVFLGGPGSGKSTIGQFLAQIHRAALLDRRPPHKLESKIKTAIREIKAYCNKEDFAWPSTPRYPFRVELNAFAKALSEGHATGIKTFSAYLRQRLSQDSVLSHEDLREWLRIFPWLLILDGLDEVPSSSNRREVIEAIQNFLNEARDVEADLMIVASSRPDGYANEFDGDEVTHRYLLPLSKLRALACAERYVNSKVASKDDHRSIEIMTTLTSAIENQQVARLMRSPLQVTFMVTVVAASGKPSESRWQLFNDYYRIIYERELHKAVRPFDRVLNEKRQNIDTLHHRVGFILQCRAESSGNTQADLSINEFEQLVVACLEEDGLSAKDLTEQKQMILGAANQRLVFLTSRTPGRLSFDVRSLQEYMAAASITDADSDLIFLRLKKIAHSAYWRNTLLFAVGRFFIDAHLHVYRDKIRALCEDLNREKPEQEDIKLGSHLALDILESGIVSSVPLIMKSLTACALELLNFPPDDENQLSQRLADIYMPPLETEYQKAIKLMLGQSEMTLTLSAWVLLLQLEKKQIAWAIDLAREKWPEDKRHIVSVMTAWSKYLINEKFFTRYILSESDTDRLEKLLPKISIADLGCIFSNINIEINKAKSSWLSPLIDWLCLIYENDKIKNNLLIDNKSTGIGIDLTSIPNQAQALNFSLIKKLGDEEDLHSDWKILVELADFFIDPNAATLANALKFMAEACAPENWSVWKSRLPWPLACCLNSTSSKAELLKLSETIRLDQFEGLSSWKSQQEIWAVQGVNLDDLCAPLIQSEDLVCLANAIPSISIRGLVDKNVINDLFDLLINTNQPKAKENLAWIIAFCSEGRGGLQAFDPNQIKEHILPARSQWMIYDFDNMSYIKASFADWICFYDAFGKLNNLKFSGFSWNRDKIELDLVLSSFNQDRSRLGLLRLAGFWCAAGLSAQTKISVLELLQALKEPRFQLAIILVRMSQNDLTQDEANQMASYFQPILVSEFEPDVLNILMSALEHHAPKIPALKVMLKSLIKLIPVNEWQLHARAMTLYNSLIQALSSGLSDNELLKLKLPLLTNDCV